MNSLEKLLSTPIFSGISFGSLSLKLDKSLDTKIRERMPEKKIKPIKRLKQNTFITFKNKYSREYKKKKTQNIGHRNI